MRKRERARERARKLAQSLEARPNIQAQQLHQMAAVSGVGSATDGQEHNGLSAAVASGSLNDTPGGEAEQESSDDPMRLE